MMFVKNNNGGNSVNVNTKLYTSYSDESLLTVSAWNSNVSIKLQPAKGKDDDGLTIYSNEQVDTVTATVTPETAQVLLAGIDEIVDAIKNNKPESIGVVAGVNDKRKVINLSTDGTNVNLSLVFGGTINTDGTSTNTNVINHTFNNRSYTTAYSKDNGGEVKTIPSDFYAFIAKVKEIKYVDGAISHGINYNNAIKSSYSSNKNNQQQTQNTYSAPVTNLGDGSMEDFIPFN